MRRGRRFDTKKKQRVHSKFRFQTRHGVSVNRKDLGEMVKSIQSGEARFVKRKSIRVSVWDVEFNGNTYRVFYDRKRKNVVTTLPGSF